MSIIMSTFQKQKQIALVVITILHVNLTREDIFFIFVFASLHSIWYSSVQFYIHLRIRGRFRGIYLATISHSNFKQAQHFFYISKSPSPSQEYIGQHAPGMKRGTQS